MTLSYYGEKLSENMIETDEGYLICQNVPLGRVGWMEYLGRELPAVFDEPPDQVCQVYRSPDEVFRPETIASFEGKPVTNAHPQENLTIDTISLAERGHAQNVRRSGDFLVGDLYIKDVVLKEDILNKIKREVSSGYECLWVPVGEHKYEQKNILGNHVAVVQNGRAGHMVAIQDSLEGKVAAKSAIQDEENPRKTGGKTRMKWTKDLLLAFGIKHLAKDAEPEEVAQAVQAAHAGTASPGEATSVAAKTPGNDADGETGNGDVDKMAMILDKMGEILDRIDALESREEQQAATAEDEFSNLEKEMQPAADEAKEEASKPAQDEDDVENTIGEENEEAMKHEAKDESMYQKVADTAFQDHIRVMKKAILAVPDQKTRDELARQFTASVRDARQVGTKNTYSEIAKQVAENKKSAMDKATESNNRKSETMQQRCDKSAAAWQKAGAAMRKGGQ